MPRAKLIFLLPLFLLVALVAESNRSGHSSPAAAPLPAADPNTSPVPVVIELFTSQGCSSCPPADAFLKDLATAGQVGPARIIPLAFHVDYWDRLGWRDPYSSAQATTRQRDYAHAKNLRSLYTPQMIVNGGAEFVGSDRTRGLKALESAATVPPAATLKIAPSGSGAYTLRIEPTADFAPGSYDLFLAVTESGLTTDIPRGENRGLKLEHTAVVRSFQRIQTLDLTPGTAKSSLDVPLHPEIDPAWNRDHSSLVLFLQRPNAGPIIAAAATNLTQ